MGIETPLGPGMISVKTGLWLVMPAAACAVAAPRTADVTDFEVWLSAGPMSASPTTDLAQRVDHLGAPIDYLTPAEGHRVARRILDQFAAAHPELEAGVARARRFLELYAEDGTAITDRGLLLALCKTENGEACARAADPGPEKERRALLTRSCELANDNACEKLGRDLRARALVAARALAEIEELTAFVCGIGKRAYVTPLLQDPTACPPPPPAPLAR
ncbi:hypothetical protein BH09MYX1_BH09MYX1_23340 [soil metagenome]